jgi:hypothetical protein
VARIVLARSVAVSRSELTLISANASVRYGGSGLGSIVSSAANLDGSMVLRVSARGNL